MREYWFKNAHFACFVPCLSFLLFELNPGLYLCTLTEAGELPASFEKIAVWYEQHFRLAHFPTPTRDQQREYKLLSLPEVQVVTQLPFAWMTKNCLNCSGVFFFFIGFFFFCSRYSSSKRLLLCAVDCLSPRGEHGREDCDSDSGV